MAPTTRSMTRARSVVRGARIAFPVRGPWRASSWVDKKTGKHKLRFTRTTRRTLVQLLYPAQQNGLSVAKDMEKEADGAGEPKVKRKGAAERMS